MQLYMKTHMPAGLRSFSAGKSYSEPEELVNQFLIVQCSLCTLKRPPNEPPHDKTNKMTCAPREDSDQPRHPPCLISVFAVHSMGS